MVNTLKWISNGMEIIFYTIFVILFYHSLGKCFLKEGKSKSKLLLRSLFTNPLVCYFEAILVVSAIICIMQALGAEELAESMMKMVELEGKTVTFSLASVIYLIMLFFFAKNTAKWLETQGKPLVIFVYLMYGVIMELSMGNIGEDAFSNNESLGYLIKMSRIFLLLAGMILLYQWVIKPLAELTDRPYRTDWKIFVIPPAVFNVFYIGVINIVDTFLNEQAYVVLYGFSSMVMYLFIWTFYVIIKNINATSEAIMARDEVKKLSVEVMEALAHTIDAKDEYTKGHSVRVARYSRMLAEKLELSKEECENVYYMALLHDIGKIGVPNSIINSKEKLTEKEYAVIKTHPGVGYDILAEIKSRPDLAIGARWHHERYDGGGYPDGKKGEEIPLSARIISVADSYDAMTSNRSYRKYLSQEAVRTELEKNSGTQFDPDIAECMIDIMKQDVNYELHE